MHTEFAETLVGRIMPGNQETIDFDMDQATDGLFDAYGRMAEGVHRDYQASLQPSGSSMGMNTRVTTWINGTPAQRKTEFLVNGVQPDYVNDYIHKRNQVYSGLLNRSIASGDFTFFIATINTLKDPYLANRLLNQIYASKQRYPDMIVGSRESILGRIDRHNSRIKDIKLAINAHALKQKHLALRKQLYDDRRGPISAIAIGVKARSAGGLNKYKQETVITPLRNISKLPHIQKQLLDKEKHGKSLLD